MTERSGLSGRQRDIILGGLFLIFAITFFGLTFMTSGYELESVPFDMGPTFMPRLMLGALVFESVVFILLTVSRPKNDQPKALAPIFQKRPIILLGVFMIYVYITSLVGYIPATIVFMVVGFLLLGIRSLWVLILISPLVTITTYFLFSNLLNIYLPTGSLL